MGSDPKHLRRLARVASGVEIPVIDLTQPRTQVVAELARTYEALGFASVVGHGISDELVADVFEVGDRFHALPIESKLALARNENHRGFISLGSSTDRASEIENVTQPNQSESFMLMREAAAGDPDVEAGVYLAGPNQWPDIDGFSAAIERYQAAMGSLGQTLIELFIEAIGADAPPAGAFDPPTTWLRLLRYPPRPQQVEGVYGSAPHVDFGAITLLAQDDVGGLEVQAPTGAWIAVDPQPQAFVLNTGAVMRTWSAGRFRATPHRVINRSDIARRSVAFFYDPHMNTPVAPLNAVGQEGASLFADLVRRELDSGYADPRP